MRKGLLKSLAALLGGAGLALTAAQGPAAELVPVLAPIGPAATEENLEALPVLLQSSPARRQTPAGETSDGALRQASVIVRGDSPSTDKAPESLPSNKA